MLATVRNKFVIVFVKGCMETDVSLPMEAPKVHEVACQRQYLLRVSVL